MLIPFGAAPLWMARARAGAWLSPWAALLCAGTLLALAFLFIGGVAPGAAQALTLGTSMAWVGATVIAAWRVRDGARRGSVTAAASTPAGHDTPATRLVD
jgi:predicted lipid-binding transport protein (Tim44 family)